MAILRVPSVLRSKLGDEATEGLVDFFTANQQDQETRFVRVFKDTIALRIMESEEKMSERIQASEQRLSGEINDLRKVTSAGFLDMQKQITGVQAQISLQTRWLIGIASFLAVVMKMLDVIFPSS